ncbi:MAG: cytochrome c oxidase subunit II [Pseudomonadota bacterium]
MSTVLRRGLSACALGLGVWGGHAVAQDPHPVPLNLPVGVTDISAEVYDLHMLIFYICCAIAVAVFGVMFYSILYHRKSRGVKAANFHHSTAVEIVWTAIPLVILIAMAVPAAKTLIAMEDTSEADLTIKITGYQWKWHYDYMGHDVDFFSSLHPDHNAARQTGSGIDVNDLHWYLKEVDNELVLPVGRKVRFLHTAADVIHAWWVPDLAVKRDSIPGFINENWAIINEPGVYRGKCAELCGRDHGFMPVVVRAVPAEEFDAWLSEQQGEEEAEAVMQAAEDAAEWGLDDLIARGKTVYDANCVACHQANGQGLPPTFPAITDSPVALGPIDDHIAIIKKGKAGTAMAAFGGVLSDSDIAAVVTFQRNGLGNSVGDLAQPADVVAN